MFLKEEKTEIEFFAPKCKVIGGVQCWTYARRKIKRYFGSVWQYYTTAKKSDAQNLFDEKSVNSPFLKTRRTMA